VQRSGFEKGFVTHHFFSVPMPAKGRPKSWSPQRGEKTAAGNNSSTGAPLRLLNPFLIAQQAHADFKGKAWKAC